MYKRAGDGSALRWGEKTGQMNSTCRGEGEGLNCKTRRQRSCALKAGRDKRCLRVICTLGTGSGRVALRGSGERTTTSSPSVQSVSQESSRLRGHRGVETVAQTKENTQTHVTNRNDNQINQAWLQQLPLHWLCLTCWRQFKNWLKKKCASLGFLHVNKKRTNVRILCRTDNNTQNNVWVHYHFLLSN